MKEEINEKVVIEMSARNELSEEDTSLLSDSVKSGPSTLLTYYSVMFTLLKSELPLTITGCVVLICRLPFSMSLSYWISMAFGSIFEKNSELLYHAILYFSISGSIDALLDFWCVFIFAVIQNRISRKLRERLFATILTQPMSFFDSTTTGELMSRLTSDTSETANQLSWTCRFTIEALIRVTGVAAYMFTSSWRLAVLVCVLIPFNSFIAQIYGKWSARNALQGQDAQAVANSFASEIIHSISTVKAFRFETASLNKYKQFLETYFSFQLKEAAMRGLYYMVASTFLMTTVAQAALLGYGGYLVLHDQMKVDTLISFILYRGQLQEWCSSILDNYSATLRSAGAGSKIIQILNLDSERIGGEATKGGLIEFENVCFRYELRPALQVLKNVSFRVKSGQVVALVGTSGSGKTSILSLLQGFYSVDSGDIRIGGVSIKRVDLKCLRQSVLSVVSQEPVLFRGTIRENILVGIRNDVVDADLKIAKALEIACIKDFVESLPGGLECLIGERGAQLSGGQKQRIAIARAIIKDPEILLLDEATSSLDAESEETVQRALENAMRGRTTIMISHKLSSAINYANWIVVIGKGAVVEQGTPEQLLAFSDVTNPLSFGALLKRQSN